jgi:hypothetical protein
MQSMGSNSWFHRHKSLATVAAYYSTLIVALLLSRWLLGNIGVGTLIILLVLVAPFIAGRLSTIEYGGLKVELRELKVEVKEARSQLTQEVSEVREEVNKRLAQLESQARNYLATRDQLPVADAMIAEMRNTIDLSKEELKAGLDTLDAGRRIPSYVQLQVQPDQQFIPLLAPCYWLEQYYANTTGDTKPLWQLLVATERCWTAGRPERVATELLMNMKHCLEFLQMSSRLDRGGQCKARLGELVAIVGRTD